MTLGSGKRSARCGGIHQPDVHPRLAVGAGGCFLAPSPAGLSVAECYRRYSVIRVLLSGFPCYRRMLYMV